MFSGHIALEPTGWSPKKTWATGDGDDGGADGGDDEYDLFELPPASPRSQAVSLPALMPAQGGLPAPVD